MDASAPTTSYKPETRFTYLLLVGVNDTAYLPTSGADGPCTSELLAYETTDERIDRAATEAAATASLCKPCRVHRSMEASDVDQHPLCFEERRRS